MTDQTWNPDRYARNARFVAELGMPVVDLLNPLPGERILDLGCGDGALTAKLVALGCRVVGVDSSPEQIEAARARGLDAHVVDARNLRFEAEFEAVFSNAVLHWIPQADAAIAGVGRALKPGGRFVGEMGGQGNIVQIKTALAQALARRNVDADRVFPWYFPSPAEYRTRLEAGGFEVNSISLFPRPTPLPGDMIAWLETFAGGIMAALPPDDRLAFLSEVQETLRPTLSDEQGNWTADYVRLRFAARKSVD
jgi:trans-aconitate methyltransferase